MACAGTAVLCVGRAGTPRGWWARACPARGPTLRRTAEAGARGLVGVQAMKVGVYWTTGSRTTAAVAKDVVALLEDRDVDAELVNVRESQDFAQHDALILGMPSYKWGDDPNELPSALDFDTLSPPPDDAFDLMGKKVALFGTGDRESYLQYYVEGLARVWRLLDQRGATLVGRVDVDDVGFEGSSRAIVNGKFVGLPVDDNDDPKEKEAALRAWVERVVEEFRE